MNVVPLGDLVEIKGGGTPDKSISAYWGGNVPWASVKDFKSNEISQTIDSITEIGVERSATNVIPAGSILVPTRMAVGKAAINTIDLAINQDLKALKVGARADARYLLHALLAQASVLERQATGATVRGITLEVLRQLPIPLPSLAEQRRRAATLDLADTLRRKAREAASLLARLPLAIFKEMFGTPSENPKNFESCTLGSIVDFIGGTQPPKSTFLYEDGPGRVRFVQTRDFKTDAYKTYLPLNLAKRPFTERDVMVGRYGPPVFQIFRGLSGTYNVALMKAEPRRGIDRDFLFYLLQEPSLHNFVVANSVRTAGQSGVNLSLLEKCPVFRPPMELQADFSSKIAHIDVQMRLLRQSRERLDALFISLQHGAFAAS